MKELVLNIVFAQLGMWEYTPKFNEGIMPSIEVGFNKEPTFNELVKLDKKLRGYNAHLQWARDTNNGIKKTTKTLWSFDFPAEKLGERIIYHIKINLW